MPALPPTRSPRCMRCAMMRRKPLGGSIEPGATAIQRSHTSSTTPSSCVTRTICASLRSARKWACRRLQRLESGPESVGSPTLRRESVGCERPVCGKLRSRALRPLLAALRRMTVCLRSVYCVEKLYLLTRPKNLRALQAVETTTHEGTLPHGAHLCPSSCIGLGAYRVHIKSRECARQKNHVVADLLFFNRIDPERKSEFLQSGHRSQ